MPRLSGRRSHGKRPDSRTRPQSADFDLWDEFEDWTILFLCNIAVFLNDLSVKLVKLGWMDG